MDLESLKMAEKLLKILNKTNLLRADSALKIASTVIKERSSLVIQKRYGPEFILDEEAV